MVKFKIQNVSFNYRSRMWKYYHSLRTLQQRNFRLNGKPWVESIIELALWDFNKTEIYLNGSIGHIYLNSGCWGFVFIATPPVLNTYCTTEDSFIRKISLGGHDYSVSVLSNIFMVDDVLKLSLKQITF